MQAVEPAPETDAPAGHGFRATPLGNTVRGMMITQSVVEALALSILLTALFVAGRLLWCLVIALRARRYMILAISVIGLVCVVAALGMVVIVWFGYAVAHIEKTATTDLKVLFYTVPPFFLVSIGLWLLAGALHSRLPPRVVKAP
jgi:hypothetical protein